MERGRCARSMRSTGRAHARRGMQQCYQLAGDWDYLVIMATTSVGAYRENRRAPVQGRRQHQALRDPAGVRHGQARPAPADAGAEREIAPARLKPRRPLFQSVQCPALRACGNTCADSLASAPRQADRIAEDRRRFAQQRVARLLRRFLARHVLGPRCVRSPAARRRTHRRAADPARCRAACAVRRAACAAHRTVAFGAALSASFSDTDFLACSSRNLATSSTHHWNSTSWRCAHRARIQLAEQPGEIAVLHVRAAAICASTAARCRRCSPNSLASTLAGERRPAPPLFWVLLPPGRKNWAMVSLTWPKRGSSLAGPAVEVDHVLHRALAEGGLADDQAAPYPGWRRRRSPTPTSRD